MRKTLVLIPLVLALVPWAPADAGTMEDEYLATLGVSVLAPIFAFRACSSPQGCDFLGDDGLPCGGFSCDGERDVPAIGANEMWNPGGGLVRNVVASANDLLYGPATAINLCVENSDGEQSICMEGEDMVTDVNCGPQFVQSPWSTNKVTVWYFTIHVSDALDVCGAMSGEVAATFF